MRKINLPLMLIVLLAVIFIKFSFALAFDPGDKVEVLWQDKWWAATVKKVNGNQCYIHYDGWEKKWDEWVGPDRIRSATASSVTSSGQITFSAADPVKVLWQGTWYDAHILKAKGGKYLIHYDGWESKWDEWVGLSRIKPRD